MNILSRTPRRFLTAAGFAALFCLLPAQSRADECSGDSCESKDPLLMGCTADAYYLDFTEVIDSSKPVGEQAIGNITLYYSPTCDAKWAVLLGQSELPSTKATASLDDGAGGVLGLKSKTVSTIAGVFVRSLMTSGGHIVSACATLEYPDSGRIGQGCTAPY